MPTIEVSLNDLDNLVGKKLSRYEDDLWEAMDCVKGEVESIEDGTMKLEIGGSDRPDLWCVEGVARQLRGFLGLAKGAEKYSAKDTDLRINVDSRLKKVRPFIACCVVKGVTLTDHVVKQLMQQQEKLDASYGRNRRRTSIGLYNFDMLKFPLRYTMTRPDENAFVPLDFLKEMTPREIVKVHPKGKEYGRILGGLSDYPIFLDDDGKVLSLPPVINSNNLGKVGEKTKNILIEVTGTDYKSVNTVLAIVAAGLADRGGKLYSVKINYPYLKGDRTPHFEGRKMRLDARYVNSVLGTGLKADEIAKLLAKSRLDAAASGNRIDVTVPFYRVDVMHPIDLVEDVVIANGYGNLQSEELVLPTIGAVSERERLSDKVRNIMVSMGFQEAMTFTLTNKSSLITKMGLPDDEVVEIANPVSLELTHLRNWLLPGMLRFLSDNKHHEYPQRIFESGDCVAFDDKNEMRTRNARKLCCAVSYDNANLTEMKSYVEALLKNLGVDYGIRAMNHPSFIETRCGMIVANEKIVGFFGEVHPRVLQNWRLEKPVIAFEIDLDKLI